MAALFRARSVSVFKAISSRTQYCSILIVKRNASTESTEVTTHTGQVFEADDYRRVRFMDKKKLVNERFAIDLVAKEPVVVCEQKTVFSDGGGALGHPRVFINLDQNEVQVCGYSGRKFIHQKYYDPKIHGPSVTYEEYIEEINPQQQDWPN